MNGRRCVVDTNVLISAALSKQGNPHRVVSRILERGHLLASVATFGELTAVLHRPKFDRFLRARDRVDYLSLIQASSRFIQIREHVEACRDLDDDKFLDLAISGSAALVVTGDADLLALHPFRGIPIVTPAKFLERGMLED